VFPYRILMQLTRDMGRNLERNSLELMLGEHWSVGYMENTITRRIIHCTRVVGLISIMLRRPGKLGMLVITFLKFM